MILHPMRFAEIGEFFPKMSYENKVIVYCLFGGIPAYLEQFSLIENAEINTLLAKVPFAKLSIFKGELLTELQMSINKPSTYLQILFGISQGKQTFSKISDFVKTETKNISRYLELLINVGLIERIIPFLTKKLTYYSIKDNFTKFWMRFFYPFKNEIELYSPDEFVNNFVIPRLNEYMGNQFESFCREYLQELSKKKLISDLIYKTYNYQEEIINKSEKQRIPVEIDIIAETVSKKFLFIAECKWWTRQLHPITIFLRLNLHPITIFLRLNLKHRS